MYKDYQKIIFRVFGLGIFSCLIFSSALADSIKLINGDVVNGQVIVESEDSVRLVHPDLGEIEIPRLKIDTLYLDVASDSPALVAVTHDPESGVEWDRKVGFGLYGNGSSGNAVNNNIHLEFSADYENSKQRWLSRLAYDLQTTGGNTSQNKFYAQLDRDWLMPGSHWFWFARGRYDWDKFKDWESRVTGILGPGYQFVDDDKWNVRGRSGIGGSYTWGGPENGAAPEAQMGLNATWNMAKNHSLDAASTFYVSLRRANEYRNITSLDWRIDIDSLYQGMAVKFGVYNEYESEVDGDHDNSDFKYRFSVLVGL